MKYLILFLLTSFFSFDSNYTSELAIKIEEVINEKRKEKKLTTLAHNPCLKKAAQNHADYLVGKNQLSHFQKNKKMHDPKDRVLHYNCKPKVILENVAYIAYDESIEIDTAAEKLFKLWNNSKNHRDNLLNKNITHSAVGISIDTNKKRIIAVQVFTAQ